MAEILTQHDAQELCERVLSQSTADEAQVNLRSGVDSNTRFAVNQITTSGDVVDTQVTVTVRFGRRSASLSFNRMDDTAIAEAVATAERLAEVAPADPEQMPMLGPQEYQLPVAFFESTYELSPAERVRSVEDVIEPAAARGLLATGFLERRARMTAVANSSDLFAYHRFTLASYTTTMRTAAGDGSGWAGTTHNDWSRMVPLSELAARAIAKAESSTGAEAIDPGAYTVVLEPTAVGNLVQLLAQSLSARSADEGRSYFSRQGGGGGGGGGGGNKIGEQVADERVTLYSDPSDVDLLDQPFTTEGQPAGRRVWIEDGVLTNLAYSRFWAEQQGRDPVPSPGGIKMPGESGTTADLVAAVDRGLLVTRFWYIRSLDRRTLRYTGLTRDGTFLIEDGRIVRAVKNLRFNQSVISMLQNVVGMGAAVRVVASESGGLGRATVVPPLLVRDFHFSSVSDAV